MLSMWVVWLKRPVSWRSQEPEAELSMGPWACPSGPEAACAFICFLVSPGSPHSELSLPFIKASQ